MRRHRWFVAAAICGAMLTAVVGTGTAAGQTFVNWTQYLYSPGYTSDNQAATIITPANAAMLKWAWRFTPSAAPVSGLAGFYSSPTVYDGVIYIGARNGYFYAINETTGKQIWRRFIGIVTAKSCGPEGFTSTATVAPDPTTGTRRYTSTARPDTCTP